MYTHGDFPGAYNITGVEFFNTSYNSSSNSLNSGSVTISLSTTAANWNTLSTSFAANLGGNNTQEFSGTIGGPWAFGDSLTFNFSTPFLYDPSVGNLLMDVNASLSGGGSIFFDTNGLYAPNTDIGRVFEFGGSGNSIGVTTGYGLVTEFIGSPVPEPSSIVLLGSAMLVAAYLIRRKTRVVPE